MIRHIVWDWNGTLFNDVMLGLESANALLTGHDMPLLAEAEDYRQIFGFPIDGYYQRLGFRFERVPFEQLAAEWMAFYQPRSLSCSLTPGAEEALRFLRERGTGQTLLSASHREKLLEQVRQYAIETYFDGILGIEDIYAKSKLELAKRFFSQGRVSPVETLFIGDSLHDWEVAAEVGAKCLLYTRGHQCETALLHTGCPLINNLNRLPEFLQAAEL